MGEKKPFARDYRHVRPGPQHRGETGLFNPWPLDVCAPMPALRSARRTDESAVNPPVLRRICDAISGRKKDRLLVIVETVTETGASHVLGYVPCAREQMQVDMFRQAAATTPLFASTRYRLERLQGDDFTVAESCDISQSCAIALLAQHIPAEVPAHTELELLEYLHDHPVGPRSMASVIPGSSTF